METGSKDFMSVADEYSIMHGGARAIASLARAANCKPGGPARKVVKMIAEAIIQYVSDLDDYFSEN